MNTVRTLAFGALGWLLAAMVWANLSAAGQAQSIPSGSPMADAMRFQFAVFFPPKSTEDPLAVLSSLLEKQRDAPEWIRKPPDKLAKPVLMAVVERDLRRYAPPDVESLRYFGRGLSREQGLALQKSGQVLILNFGHSKRYVWRALRAASELVEGIARKTGGLIWDEETREIFTPDAWHKNRLDSWTGVIPDVTVHTTIHAYNTGTYVRAITLGMAKFGLPDVVVTEFSWSLNRNVGHLINALAQAMAEGAAFSPSGEYLLDFRAIKNKTLRDKYLGSLLANSSAKARLTFRPGVPDQGDPDNRLLEITFDGYPGNDVHARQTAMMDALFGWHDEVKRVRHDPVLESASQKARTSLPALRAVFNKGLVPGEYVQVKAPFVTPSGSKEWMWVEVTEWKSGAIRGVLKNEPFDIPDLHGGQEVRVEEAEVFDYIRHFADGREEGNETGKILEKMQGRIEKKN